MKWGLALTNPARRVLRDAPRADVAQIDVALREMEDDPLAGDVKFLRGTHHTLRRRVGAWRILYELRPERRLIVVLDVMRRDSNTY